MPHSSPSPAGPTVRLNMPLAAMLALSVAFTACTSADTATETTSVATDATATTLADAAADEEYTVAIALIGAFGQVVVAIEGFKEALAQAGLIEGENLRYIEYNAQSDQSVVPLMARQVVAEDPDLIMVFGTPVVIALAQETETIPIVFTAMADPLAAGVIDDVEAPGTNLTGTSNLIDPEFVLGLVTDTLPNVENVGMIVNPGEQNSANQLAAFEAEALTAGLEIVTAPVATTGDVVPAATSLEGRVDAVVLLQDNTVSEAYETVADTLIRAGIPIFVASTVQIEAGFGLVGFGFDVRQLGFATGEQAVQILLDGADPAEMPVIFANSPATGGLDVAVNLGMAELLGIEVPDSVLEDADVYEETPFAD